MKLFKSSRKTAKKPTNTRPARKKTGGQAKSKHAHVPMTPIPPELLKLLKQQMQDEYQAAFCYLQQTSYFEALGLTGFSKWLKNHYTEELSHGTAIMNYLLSRGVKVHIPNVTIPHKWQTLDCPDTIFEALLAKEVASTKSINVINKKSIEWNDFQTAAFAQKLIKKATEEEYVLSRLVKRIRFAKKDPGALLEIDQELEDHTINEGVISANYRVLTTPGYAGEEGSAAVGEGIIRTALEGGGYKAFSY
jgi:ferritin